MTERRDGLLTNQGHSETAATVGNPLYGPSGSMTYRVTLANGAALSFRDVEAETGDRAAELALAGQPGLKVVLVEPAPQKAKEAA